jgi:hypothetical protein
MKKLLIIVAVPAMFFLGCKPKPAPSNTKPPAPVACFTISKNLIDSGETVTTTNCSTHASSYAWNFGLGVQSSSTHVAPSYTYTNPARGTVYSVKLIAYGSSNQNNEKDTSITLGYRRIDSVIVQNIPGYAPTSSVNMVLQFGPHSNDYTSPPISASGYPFTFHFDGLTPKIYMTSANDQAWRGRIINTSNTSTIFPIAPATPIYLSRGLDVDPIVVKDNSTPPFEMDVYYSLSATDK